MVQERPVRVERTLSAILVADVAGYSRLVRRDGEATHAKLILAESFTPAIAEHGGRIEYRPPTRYLPNRGKGDLFFLYPPRGSAHVDC
jgi:hypothetical protein